MPVSLRHGGQGSYKTAHAVWYQLLPQLRAGRLCITNVKGMKKLEEIEHALGESFPASAELWILDTQTDDAIKHMAEWFVWSPFGAFLLIDEVAKIYPKRETAFKKIIRDNYDFEPEVWEFVDADGVQQTKELIRPSKLTIAFDEHRHYGWDICLTCVNKDFVYEHVLRCVEWCYHHRSLDNLSILGWRPRYRKPRIIQHFNYDSPKPYNAFRTTFDFIPIDVHKIYSSTAAVYENTTSKNLLAGQFTKIYVLGAVILGLYVLASVALPSVVDAEDASVTDMESSAAVRQTDSQVSPVHSVVPASSSASQVSSSGVSHVVEETPEIPSLPFGVSELYMSGFYKQPDSVPVVFFTGYYSDGTRVDFISSDLPAGTVVRVKHACGVDLINRGHVQSLRCRPDNSFKPKAQQDMITPKPLI